MQDNLIIIKQKELEIKIWTYSIYSQIYCGEYKNNQRNGMGYCKLPTGALFIGEYKDNIIDGFGTLITYEGLKFIGDVYEWYAVSGQWYDQENNKIDIEKMDYEFNGGKYVGEQ